MSDNLPARATGHSFKAIIAQQVKELEAAKPAHLTTDKIVRVAWSAIRDNPQLLECEVGSLVVATIKSAQLGLLLDGFLGQAYLVPYNKRKKLPNGQDIWLKEAQLQIGYKGYMQLARNTGEICVFKGAAVYQNDYFEYEEGFSPKLIHKPLLSGDRGEFVAAYAYVQFKDGSHDCEVMARNEIEKIRDNSQAYKTALKWNKTDTPWIEHFERMAVKCPVRRLGGRLPLSADKLQQAAAIEELAELDARGYSDLGNLPEAPTDDWAGPFDALASRRPDVNREALALFVEHTAAGWGQTKQYVCESALARASEFWPHFDQWEAEQGVIVADEGQQDGPETASKGPGKAKGGKAASKPKKGQETESNEMVTDLLLDQLEGELEACGAETAYQMGIPQIMDAVRASNPTLKQVESWLGGMKEAPFDLNFLGKLLK